MNKQEKVSKKERYIKVCEYFSSNMPAPESELRFRNNFELLVSVILSAQCTDVRVNMVTPALFAAYPTALAMAEASVEDLFAIIRSVSYPNAKAGYLRSMARALVERHGGEVPRERVDLEALSGVGRKTANVVMSIAWGDEQIAVDTHVFRVARRLGLSVASTTVEDTEKQLRRGFLEANKTLHIDHLLGTAHHWLILHGRYVCTARKPNCVECGLSAFCPRVSVK